MTLNQICDDLRVPRAFLSKILQQLCRSKIVKSHKGPSGGFLLLRDPATLSMLQVVEEIEGPIRVFECFSEVGECNNQPSSCRILSMFDTVGARVQQALDGITLADFVGRATEVNGVVGGVEAPVQTSSKDGIGGLARTGSTA